MIPGVACMVCGESHSVSKCTALYIPPPEGLPNPDGGGKRAGNPEPEDSVNRIGNSEPDDSLKRKISSEQEHSQGDESQSTLLEGAL